MYDFEEQGNEFGGTLVATDTGLTILALGLYRHSNYDYKGLIFINNEGTNFDNARISPVNSMTGYGGFNALIQSRNNDYLFCGDIFYMDSLDYKLIYLHKTDESGNPIWTKTIGDGSINEFCNNAIQTPDGNYMVYSIEDIRNEDNITTETNRILTKVTPNGATVWRKTLEDEEMHTLFGNIANTRDSQHIMIYANDLLLFYEEPVIVKMDTLGNALWEKKMTPNNSSFCAKPAIRPLLNGDYAVKWCQDTIFDWETNTISPFIAILDSLGNLKKKVYFQSHYIKIIYNIKIAANGDIIGCGENRNFDIDEDGLFDNSAWIFRMRPTGEVLWERSYYSPDYPNSPHSFFDVVETSEGGIAATGYVKDTLETGEPNINVWLVQVDSTGCMFPDCQDSLLFLAVPEIDEPLITRQVFFKVFPNPVSDYLYLDFYQSIGRSDNWIELYDFSGRLVKRNILSKGTLQHELKVSELHSGMYLLRYLANGQIWQQEKIIIQN